jgi:hypothetical protein
MNRTLVVCLSATIIVLGCARVAYTQAPGKQQANNKLNKITDDLYEIEGDGGNVAFYITNEGVIVVDDKFEYDFNDIMAKIKSVTSQPVKYMLNTHHLREGKSKDDIAKAFMANGGLWVNPNVVNKLDQIMAELKN